MASSELEELLVDGIQNEDLGAFEQLFNAYYERLVTYALTKVRSVDVAEDVVQQVFCNVWRLRKSWRPRSSVKAYLYGAVRNECYDHLDRERNRARLLAEHVDNMDVAPDPGQQFDLKEVQQALQQAISELPARRREIFELARDHGLSYAEIATMLGISVNTVDVQLVRATRFLRERLSTLLSFIW